LIPPISLGWLAAQIRKEHNVNILDAIKERRHITALESVWLRHGFPLSYYVDSHSIFMTVVVRELFLIPFKTLNYYDTFFLRLLDNIRTGIMG